MGTGGGMIIYKVENIINNKCYIGKTIQNFEKYKNSHFYHASKNTYLNRVFHRAIRKYGWEKFKWKVLWKGKCSDNWLNELEKYYIYFYDSFGSNGYNMTKGGDGAESGDDNVFCKLSHKRRKEIIGKGNEKRRKYKHTETTKEKMSRTRKKMYKGRKNPQTKNWLVCSPKGNEFIVKDGLNNFCKKYNLAYETMMKWINKGSINPNFKNGKRTEKLFNTIGWSVSRI